MGGGGGARSRSELGSSAVGRMCTGLGEHRGTAGYRCRPLTAPHGPCKTPTPPPLPPRPLPPAPCSLPGSAARRSGSGEAARGAAKWAPAVRRPPAATSCTARARGRSLCFSAPLTDCFLPASPPLPLPCFP
jgi:hypothetical protein